MRNFDYRAGMVRLPIFRFSSWVYCGDMSGSQGHTVTTVIRRWHLDWLRRSSQDGVWTDLRGVRAPEASGVGGAGIEYKFYGNRSGLIRVYQVIAVRTWHMQDSH